MPPAAPRRIAVCADDFGMDAGASQAILELMSAERVLSASVLVCGPAAAQFSGALAALRSPNRSIGLHFTLTEFVPNSDDTSLLSVLLRSQLRLLGAAKVRASFEYQLKRFEELFACSPQYIDGHEHVHQFPMVRDMLVEVVSQRYGSAVAIRCTRTRCPRGVKAAIISGLGSSQLQSSAVRSGLRVNRDFAGVYAFQPGRYRQHMQGWLSSIADGGLIMCHPRLRSDADSSPASVARNEEQAYLKSPQWIEDLAQHAVQLAPFAAA